MARITATLRAGDAIDARNTFLRRRLIAYQAPVYDRFVEDFPRTPSMKPSALGSRALFAVSGADRMTMA